MCVYSVLHEVINIIIVDCISALAASMAYGDYNDDGQGHTHSLSNWKFGSRRWWLVPNGKWSGASSTMSSDTIRTLNSLLPQPHHNFPLTVSKCSWSMFGIFHNCKIELIVGQWGICVDLKGSTLPVVFSRGIAVKCHAELFLFLIRIDWFSRRCCCCCCWFVCREYKTLECVGCCGQYASNWEALTAIKIVNAFGGGDLRTLLLDYITHYHNRSCYFMFMVCAYHKLQLTRSQHGDRFFPLETDKCATNSSRRPSEGRKS